LPTSNYDWQTDPSAGELAQYGLGPSDPHEAGMVRNLPPGAYTVFVSAAPGTQFGVAVLEIYELSNNTSEKSRLTNISTRCYVGTGDDVAIAGTILGHPYTGSDNLAEPDRRMLVFGRGPSLAPFGINALPDTHIELSELRPSDTVPARFIASADDMTSASGEPASSGFSVQYFDTESALWSTLRPGTYSATLSGAGGTTGVGLIEFYEY
jgi:hypothetical protein